MNELILNWQRSVELDENLLYKKAADRQAIFIRDTICRNLLKTPCFVVSHHMSKSCLLPVYFFKLTNGIEVICRDNFYGWVVSIKTPSAECAINLSSDLAHGDSKDGDGIRNGNIYPVYCEGFKEEWVYPYKSNHALTVRVDSDFHFWALMRELNAYEWTINDTEQFDVPQTEESILGILYDAKRVNNQLKFSDIFEKTWYQDCKEYYVGCFELWNDDKRLAEHLIGDDSLFNTFIQEWQKLKYGIEFNTKN